MKLKNVSTKNFIKLLAIISLLFFIKISIDNPSIKAQPPFINSTIKETNLYLIKIETSTNLYLDTEPNNFIKAQPLIETNDDQWWTFRDLGQGYYAIQNGQSGRWYLQANADGSVGYSTTNTYTTPEVQWFVEHVDGNTYRLKNKVSTYGYLAYNLTNNSLTFNTDATQPTTLFELLVANTQPSSKSNLQTNQKASTIRPTPTPIFPQSNPNLIQEAEQGEVAFPLTIVTDNSASNGKYVMLAANHTGTHSPPSNPAPDGYLKFKFNIEKDGQYLIKTWVRSKKGSEDSFYIQLDGNPWLTWNNIPQIPVFNPRAYTYVHNSENHNAYLAPYLTAGEHSVTFHYREPGVGLDKIELMLIPPNPVGETTYDVKNYGAKGNAKTNDTPAIQAAINQCSATPTCKYVLFPTGQYLIQNTVHMQNNVTLYLAADAVLIGDNNALGYSTPIHNEFYQNTPHSWDETTMIYANNKSNIGIEGFGKIHGDFTHRNKFNSGEADRVIDFLNTNNITLKDFSIEDGGHFAVMLNICSNVTIKGLKVYAFWKRDGLNIKNSHHINLSDSIIISSDDTLAFKSTYAFNKTHAVHTVTVNNVFLSSRENNAFKIGSETVDNNGQGGFRNINIYNSFIAVAGKAGIALTTNDGAIIEDMSFSNIIMAKTATPFFLNITNRNGRAANPEPGLGYIRNISFNNIFASDINSYYTKKGPYNSWTASINGHPEAKISNIQFNNVHLQYNGGGVESDRYSSPPDPVSNYTPRVLGTRPSYGWFVRHAENISFINSSVTYKTIDRRPAYFVSDVNGLTLDTVRLQNEIDDPVFVVKYGSTLTFIDSGSIFPTQKDYTTAYHLFYNRPPTADR